jgi:tetratricopeptide (TPR) repeat protein
MNKVYIPIGCGCASATLLKLKHLRSQSLPFDWILSHLAFVNDIIESLLLPDFQSIENTTNLFLDQNNSSIYSTYVYEDDESLKYTDDAGHTHDQKFEYYRTFTNDLALPEGSPKFYFNTIYKITFPHDSIDIDVSRYKKLLIRLQEILLDENTFISFVYISPSSEYTHYCIDGEPLTTHASVQLNKLCAFLAMKRGNFEIIYVDALGESDTLDQKIRKVSVVPYKNWFPMITKNSITLSEFDEQNFSKFNHVDTQHTEISSVPSLESAMQYHQNGQLEQAEAIYRLLLENNPDNFAAIHMLGVVRFQFGDLTLAEQLLLRASLMGGDVPEVHYNLGNVYAALRRITDAEACYSKALLLNMHFLPAIQQLAALKIN